MTMDNHENQPMDQKPTNEATAHDEVNASRRRFTRLGIGASGVVMTLASRSVLAQSTCKSPSGFLSNNASAHGEPAICNGTDPQGWSKTSTWPIPEDTRFVDVFGTTSAAWVKTTKFSFLDAPLSSASSWDASQAKPKKDDDKDKSAKADQVGSEVDATVREVLNGENTPEVVQYLIAAYLNSFNRSAFPTKEQVVAIYQDWHQRGYYEVSAGIQWTAPDILKYLRSTMTPSFG